MIAFAYDNITADKAVELPNLSCDIVAVAPVSQVDIIDENLTYYLSEDEIIKQVGSLLHLSYSADKKHILQEHLNKIYRIKFQGDFWHDDELVPGPSIKVISFTKRVIINLASTNIFVNRITQSIEEGISLIFINKEKTLFFEFYNDGDIGYLIEDRIKRKIIENGEENSFNEVVNRIRTFFNQIYEVS